MAQPEICIDVTVMRKKIWHIFLKIRKNNFVVRPRGTPTQYGVRIIS